QLKARFVNSLIRLPVYNSQISFNLTSSCQAALKRSGIVVRYLSPSLYLLSTGLLTNIAV
ncbi:MAG: hypothetical protein FWC19_10070, partial [Treponema sp.]|nr:hypothetical protein [Treponema sp.]MCL2273133.1 hypothetical protein [Treponema sp.]